MTAITDPLLPEDEESRIEAVRRYGILDSPPEGAYDRITALAARLFDVPIAIVSIVDTDRIWFKSHHGHKSRHKPNRGRHDAEAARISLRLVTASS